MQDEQDRAEALDDDKGGDPAPDKPPGAQAYGAAGAEPHATESVAARAAREEPDVLPEDPEREVDESLLDQAALEGTAPVPPDPERPVEEPLEAPDEEIRSVDDPTVNDIATERAGTRAAEDLAVRDPDDEPIDEAELEDPDARP